MSTTVLGLAASERVADEFADGLQKIQSEVGCLWTQVDMAVDEAEGELDDASHQEGA